ncbi:MAG: PAS domain-containing protein [Desulfobacteraceae bacterium]|nr:PAS domain-containing protein [Desulfobacteraceae bacterium]
MTTKYSFIADAHTSTSLVRFQRYVLMALPLFVLGALSFGWFVAMRAQQALETAVIASYQETQLEIVRSVARSITVYVQDKLGDGVEIEVIEQEILKRFVAPIHLLENGDAWIYAPDYVVFDLSSDFPEAYRNKSMAEIFALQAANGAWHYEAMTYDVSHAREGVGWYVWLPEKGREIAAWSPVRMGTHVWTIGLSTPLPEILQATGADRQTRLIFATMGMGTAFGLLLSLIAAWSIAGRRRTETALREVNARLEALIEALPDIIYFKDLKGHNLIVNKAFEAMTGKPRTEILGKTNADLFSPQLAESCQKSDDKVLQTRNVQRFEECSHSQDGSEIFYDSYKAPLFGGDGQLIGLVGVSRDVTQQRLAEKERRLLNEKLMRAEKMEAIGALAGGVAHDLNNLLTGLVSYPELLLQGLAEDSPLRKPLHTIQTSGERAASIVQDLLTLARRGVETIEVVDLNEQIHEFLLTPQWHKTAREYPGVHVDLRLESVLLNIEGSSTHLSKLIMNLMLNACEAMQGGGRLIIHTANRYVDGEAGTAINVSEGEYVELQISDTGKGIPSEDLGRIFEPFYSNKIMGRSGSGLGLSVVWGVAQDHNGHIDVRSTPDQGTVFTLLFPGVRSGKTRPQQALPREAFLGSNETILVVDDVGLQREVASSILKDLGYQPITVGSGEEAVAYLETHTVDLIVLDMIMPNGMDGLETYEAVTRLHPGQKAVIASGFSETDRVKTAQRLGAGTYVKKPYLMETLGTAIRSVLNQDAGEQRPGK